MRKLTGILLILFSFVAAETQSSGSYLKNAAFQVGETARYNLYFNWGFIWVHAGNVDFSVQTKKLNGKTVHSLKVIGYTIKSFEKMYTIRDTFEAFVDTAYFLPVYYKEVKHEEKYYACNQYFYDRSNKDSTMVYFDFERKNNHRWKDTVKIGNNVADLVTTCYKIRNLDISKFWKDQIVSFPMLLDNKVHDVGFKYRGKETIKLRTGGKYNAHKFTPKLVTGDLFKKEDDMTIYVSDDENHVPLLIEAKIKVGYIKAVLSDIKNTKTPMSSLISK
jgi:hypothetical protein